MSGSSLPDVEVAVVGGGLGGPAAAIALAREGFRVVLLEAREQQRPDAWGLTLWPAATRVLTWLGVGDRVVEHAEELDALTFANENGKQRFAIDVSGWGSLGRYLGTVPSVLERILLDEATARGVTVLKGRTAIGLQASYNRATLRISHRGSEELLEARMVVVCDGPRSPMRKLLGLTSIPFPSSHQTIMTAIGGPFRARELRHVLGSRWSLSATPLGEGRSWLAVTMQSGVDAEHVMASCAARDATLRVAVQSMNKLVEVSPTAEVVPRWEADRTVLMGEAAHPLLPHMGLGGSHTLEDVPAVADVVRRGLRSDRLTAAHLSEFRAIREPRVAYARLLSNYWAKMITGSSLPVRLLRDGIVGRLSRNSESVERYIQQVAGSGVPDLRTHAALLLT